MPEIGRGNISPICMDLDDEYRNAIIGVIPTYLMQTATLLSDQKDRRIYTKEAIDDIEKQIEEIRNNSMAVYKNDEMLGHFVLDSYKGNLMKEIFKAAKPSFGIRAIGNIKQGANDVPPAIDHLKLFNIDWCCSMIRRPAFIYDIMSEEEKLASYLYDHRKADPDYIHPSYYLYALRMLYPDDYILKDNKIQVKISKSLYDTIQRAEFLAFGENRRKENNAEKRLRHIEDRDESSTDREAEPESKSISIRFIAKAAE